MTPTPPTEPTLENLRELTGAPDLTEPLVSEADFDAEPIASARPLWKLPIPKLILIGLALLPVFALAGLFIAGGRKPRLANPLTTPTDSETADEEVESRDAELEQAQAEIAALKAQMALEDQGQLEPSFSSPPRSTPATAARPTPPPTTTPASISSTPPRSRPAPPPPTPVSYRPPSPVTTPVTPRSPVVTATPRPEAVVNPADRWRELAQVGSYGTVTPAEVGNESAVSRQPTNQAEFTDLPAPRAIARSTTISPSLEVTAHQSSQPEAVLQETPAFSTSGTPARSPLPAGSLSSMTTALEAPTSESPELLTAAEARILQATSKPPVLVAGTQSAGELTTPVVLEGSVEDNHFRVVLSEPLTDHQGQVAIPAGGELLVQVDAVSASGLVQLSAVQAMWEEKGWQRELRIPEGFIQIRGHEGTPLIADQYGDLGPEIAAMDAGQVALGSIRRASELYTRPSTRVETGNGSTVVTEETPEPNLLAGVLEGGTDVLLETLTERNQQAIEELEQRPRIAYIEAGRPVQVFVNQTVQMPI